MIHVLGTERQSLPDTIHGFIELFTRPAMSVDDAFLVSEAYACGASVFCTEVLRFSDSAYSEPVTKHGGMMVVFISSTEPPDNASLFDDDTTSPGTSSPTSSQKADFAKPGELDPNRTPTIR
jgi:hypothetical protein